MQYQEYMRSLESHAERKVKQQYRRAGHKEHQSSHKDGWSPVFIGYKVYLTALVVIQRYLLDHEETKKMGVHERNAIGPRQHPTGMGREDSSSRVPEGRNQHKTGMHQPIATLVAAHHGASNTGDAG